MTIFKTKEEILNCPHGLYKVYWRDGQDESEDGFSIAAIGSLYDGTRWIAATNWTGIENPTSTFERSLNAIREMHLIVRKRGAE